MKIKSQVEKIIIYHIITYSIKTLISASLPILHLHLYTLIINANEIHYSSQRSDTYLKKKIISF